MTKTRLDIVKEVYSSSKEKLSYSSQSAQSTYVRRLRNDIQTTKSFIDQADKAIEQLQLNTTGSIDEEKEVIALYDTYSKLPYISDKDDVIGIASASTIVQELVKQQAESIEEVAKINRSTEREIETIDRLINEYTQLLHHINQKIEDSSSKLEDIENRNVDLSIESKISSLEEKIEDASKMEDLLLTHMKRVITKHSALSDWEYQSVTDEKTIKERVNRSLKLINKLVKTNSWIEVYPTEFDEKLIKLMTMNDLIISRNTSSKSYLKLRDFGKEFTS